MSRDGGRHAVMAGEGVRKMRPGGVAMRPRLRYSTARR